MDRPAYPSDIPREQFEAIRAMLGELQPNLALRTEFLSLARD